MKIHLQYLHLCCGFCMLQWSFFFFYTFLVFKHAHDKVINRKQKCLMFGKLCGGNKVSKIWHILLPYMITHNYSYRLIWKMLLFWPYLPVLLLSLKKYLYWYSYRQSWPWITWYQSETTFLVLPSPTLRYFPFATSLL